MYGVYHGPDGIAKIAKQVHNGALLLAKGLQDSGNIVENGLFFDTIKVQPMLDIAEIKHRAHEMKVNLRYFEDGSVGVSLDETTTREDLRDLLWIFACPKSLMQIAESVSSLSTISGSLQESPFARQSSFMTHPVFNIHHSETEIVRYMKKLENKDISLVHSMIPLVSEKLKNHATSH